MKNIKKTGLLAAILALTFALLTACGGSSSEDKTIKVAASPTPHAEILESVKDTLADEGWTLEVIEFEDYVQPNEAVTSGDCDANFFQHEPYLEQYNEENETDIKSVAKIHFEPLGVYKGQKATFDELTEGDKVGVPNDVTNEARALQLLAANGVIKLKEGAGLTATKEDIVENPKGIEIVELEAATIPAALPDLSLAVINGNYALSADLTAEDSIAYEGTDSEAAQTYVNIIAVAAGNEETDKTKALVGALQTDEVKKFIEDKYKGSVKAFF
ncbi:MAG: ABC transporter substrate-binding protein [Clostridiales bacterium]|nr:ABC transporter substrate-binding protein [Clostridiales bacterium]